MPYISDEYKELLDGGMPVTNPGQLNYMITQTIKRYWTNSAQNYQAVNDIVGAMEGAKQEFYRRVAVPYEENKIKENGDVY